MTIVKIDRNGAERRRTGHTIGGTFAASMAMGSPPINRDVKGVTRADLWISNGKPLEWSDDTRQGDSGIGRPYPRHRASACGTLDGKNMPASPRDKFHTANRT